MGRRGRGGDWQIQRSRSGLWGLKGLNCEQVWVRGEVTNDGFCAGLQAGICTVYT